MTVTGIQIGNRIIWRTGAATVPTTAKPQPIFTPYIDKSGGSSIVDVEAGGGVIKIRKGLTWLRDQGSVRVTNRTSEWVMEYMAGDINIVGGWDNRRKVRLTPGRTSTHTAPRQEPLTGGVPDLVLFDIKWTPYDPKTGAEGRAWHQFSPQTTTMIGLGVVAAAGIGLLVAWKGGWLKKSAPAVQTNPRRRR